MTTDKKIDIVKADGTISAFDVRKLEKSLARSGANALSIERIIRDINTILYNGISTKEIYKKAFSLLRKQSPPTAARYKLKRAIMELGPTGFPFERFVGEILKHSGFRTRVGVIVKGQCVNHEVDVVAEIDNLHYMVECKFHGDSGRHCDVKIPLYIQSRFKDVEAQWLKQDGHDMKFHQGWIFTNTRFTSDAIKFGICAGLVLIGWDYPKGKSLKEQVDALGLHPITSLTTLTKHEKQSLLDKGIVLCKDLCSRSTVLKSIKLSEQRINKVLQEAKVLCNLQ